MCSVCCVVKLKSFSYDYPVVPVNCSLSAEMFENKYSLRSSRQERTQERTGASRAPVLFCAISQRLLRRLLFVATDLQTWSVVTISNLCLSSVFERPKWKSLTVRSARGTGSSPTLYALPDSACFPLPLCFKNIEVMNSLFSTRSMLNSYDFLSLKF